MNEEQQNYTYHTFEFLSKRKNDPKWRPQYLERLEEKQTLKNKREKKVIAFLLLIIVVELIILGYLMFFNPTGNEESSINWLREAQSYSRVNQKKSIG